MSHNRNLALVIDEFICRAEEHHDAGRYQEAYAIYCEALAHDPDNARLYAERGNELTWLKRREEALNDHNESIRRDPTKAYYFDSRGRNLACMAADRGGDFSAAIADYTEAIRLDPTDAAYFTDRAAALLHDDPGNADLDYRRAIELGTKNNRVYFNVAKYASYELEDWDGAIEVCTAGLTIWPDDGYLSYFLGNALSELDRHEEAEPYLATAARIVTDSATIARVHARCLYELDRFEDAVRAYGTALRLDPSDVNAWYHRGRSQWLLDNNESAYDDLSEALNLEPDADVALAVRGKVLLELDRPSEALADLDRAVEIDPEYREARRWHAEALHENDRNERALDSVLALLDDDADEPALYSLLGQIYRALDEYEEALDAFETYRKGGNEHDALIWIGICYTLMYENELALETFQKALVFDPDSKLHRFYCGIALERMGDADESRRYFDEAIATDPDWWTPYFHRGHSRQSAEEYELALADFDRAVLLAPDEAKIRWARINLQSQFEKYESVLADCGAMIEIDPQNAEPYWQRALAWDELGRSDLADADADTAERLEEIPNINDSNENTMTEEKMKIWTTLQDHFGGVALAEITLTERHFPVQVGADVQKALESLNAAGFEILHFWSVQSSGSTVTNFEQAYTKNRRYPPLAVAQRYLEIDIGEDAPVRALRDGLWLLQTGDEKLAMILDTCSDRSIRFQIATLTAAGTIATGLFQHFEDTVRNSPCYRGKILSLEYREMYSGQNQGLRVHRLRTVPREDVILPTATLELLDRNVTRFVQHRSRLTEMGLMAKKGLLFHGPPGTGKTHTIHYLSQTVPGQTTFLIAANQVTVLDEYMTLARLYQPSLVVIEDVDLIARQRDDMRSAGEELMLNKLLNEMDGLQLDAQVMFILTTNRPEALESALASRPGRIDQAIEFPLPDADGRAKLVQLYCGQFRVEESAIRKAVARTDGLTASFMKELMRRAAQFALERGENERLSDPDIEMAIEELLLLNGKLNKKLLGFSVN